MCVCVYPIFIHLSFDGHLDCFHSGESLSCSRFCIWVGNHVVFLLDNSTTSWGSFDSVQFSSVSQLCPTLCDPVNCSKPGLPVHHKHLEFTETHAHQVGDAIQPSHPLSSPSPPAPNPSQHQGLFQRVNSSHEVAKVLEFQLQHQSFK